MRMGEWAIRPSLIAIGNRQKAGDTTGMILGDLSRFAAAIAGGFDDIGEKRLVEKLSQGWQCAPVTGSDKPIISPRCLLRKREIYIQSFRSSER